MLRLAPTPATDDRDALLQRATGGDHSAFADLVRVHESMVFSIALRSLKNPAVAEDLAQEVFLQLYRNLDRIESASHLVHWLRRTAVNRCIDLIRTSREDSLEEADEPFAEEFESDPFLRERVRNAVADLPPNQRLAVILRYQEEMEPAEISRMLEMPVATVKSHLHRALLTLRRGLAGCTRPLMKAVHPGESR